MDYHYGRFRYLGQLRHNFYKNAVNRLLQGDCYAALLMPMHAVALIDRGYGKYTYSPDPTSDSLGRAYVEDQEQLQLVFLDQLRESDTFKDYSFDEQVWTKHEYMDVFDRLTQLLCNRYPLLNNNAHNLGPTKSLDDVDYPVRLGANVGKIDTRASARALSTPQICLSIVPRRTHRHQSHSGARIISFSTHSGHGAP